MNKFFSKFSSGALAHVTMASTLFSSWQILTSYIRSIKARAYLRSDYPLPFRFVIEADSDSFNPAPKNVFLYADEKISIKHRELIVYVGESTNSSNSRTKNLPTTGEGVLEWFYETNSANEAFLSSLGIQLDVAPPSSSTQHVTPTETGTETETAADESLSVSFEPDSGKCRFSDAGLVVQPHFVSVTRRCISVKTARTRTDHQQPHPCIVRFGISVII